MEQVDEVQVVTVEAESISKTNLSSSVDSNTINDDVLSTKDIPKSEENTLEGCIDHVNESVVSTTDCSVKDSIDVDHESNKGTINNDIQIDVDQPEENEMINEEDQTKIKLEDNVKCTENISLNEESTKVWNNVETLDTVKDKQDIEKHNISTVIEMDTGDTNAQCHALIKSLSQTFENKDQSLHVTDTDADTDAELSKLVDNNSEVMVLTVETVPLNDSNESVEENILVTVDEKDVTVNSNENNFLTKEKEDKEAGIINDEFELIDYNQESDGTIIEVISTEVIHSETSESCAQLENKEMLKHINTEADSVTSVTSEIIVKPEIVDNITINKDKMSENCSFNKENNIVHVKAETNDVRTETCDSSDNSNAKEKLIPSNVIVAPAYVDNSKEESISIHEIDKTSTALKKRSVIQDIFDDWGDENVDDTENDNHSESKVQDTVEIELKSLLDDPKTTPTIDDDAVVLVEEEITCIENTPVVNTKNIVVVTGENKGQHISKGQTDNNQSIRKRQQSTTKSLNKDQVNLTSSRSFGRSTRNQTSSQAKIPPIFNRSRHLVSQIASTAEVAEAVKERFREKQKIIETPPGPDIFFVKKLTQRLSSKLGGGPISSLPALIPLPQSTTQSSHCEKKVTDNTKTDTNKESSSDNKELLAILEGDVDPDWSNLKPPALTVEEKKAENADDTSSKLDPLVERELALKQLLELPASPPTKKNVLKKKKILKPVPSKATKEVETKSKSETEKEIVNINLINTTAESTVKSMKSDSDPLFKIIEQHTPEKDVELILKDVRLEESRSGRKRKPTERAREHEEQQSIVKRQKVYKSKVSPNKKQSEDCEAETVTSSDLVTENYVSKENTSPVNTENNEVDVIMTKEVIKKQLKNKTDSISSPPESTLLKQAKQSVNKKGSQSIAKKNLTVKKILKQNMSNNRKKAIALKAKLNTSSKKSGSKVVSKSKRPAENSTGEPKPKKKIINEIDRLLQDEGVVNLLYDVEQPEKKRLIPITKSQAKVMDIQKVQRELKIRKKLVRNAVLRLRTSTSGASKVSPRSKRNSIYLNDTQIEKKVEQTASAKPTNTPQSEFILPAKIRNAADASIIIRRHSSSSFSSASGSPRVSIDAPEKVEGAKIDEGSSHLLRSAKRRHSQDEKTNPKKSKKKSVQKIDAENIVVNTVEDKTKSKKSDSKKVDKNSKQSDELDETNSTSDKVMTRSNGTATGKLAIKNKKIAKNKVSFAKANESDNNEEFSKGEDELSACLAEAANALSVVNAGNRSGNSTANRKNKGEGNDLKRLKVFSIFYKYFLLYSKYLLLNIFMENCDISYIYV